VAGVYFTFTKIHRDGETRRKQTTAKTYAEWKCNIKMDIKEIKLEGVE
jgi:hypothetical protein